MAGPVLQKVASQKRSGLAAQSIKRAAAKAKPGRMPGGFTGGIPRTKATPPRTPTPVIKHTVATTTIPHQPDRMPGGFVGGPANSTTPAGTMPGGFVGQGATGAPASTTPKPSTPLPTTTPVVKINENGQLDLPYGEQFGDALLTQQEQMNSQLLDLQKSDQDAQANYTQNKRDLGQDYEKIQRGTLASNSGRGTAYSSAYGSQVADNATKFNNMNNDLDTENQRTQAASSAARTGIQTAFNNFLRKAVLDRGVELGSQAGTLGLGTKPVKQVVYGQKKPKPAGSPKPKPKPAGHHKPTHKPKPKPGHHHPKPHGKPKPHHHHTGSLPRPIAKHHKAPKHHSIAHKVHLAAAKRRKKAH